MKKGLALIIVVGILGVLAVLAAAFVMMAQLERRASGQRVNAARAYLLARSGIEDALARLEAGQDPAYGGEDWNANGALDGVEASAEIHRRGTLDVEACPVRHALRPSFFARDPSSGGYPALLPAGGRPRGYSGALSGDYAGKGNSYALKVQGGNAGIAINGGALDAQDRDPDGPGEVPGPVPLFPSAAQEVASLQPNGVPDHHDASPEGPNGFLVRLLNNLETVLNPPSSSLLPDPSTALGGSLPPLGVAIVGHRPPGGYQSLNELKPILGQARYDLFKPYLTIHAWVDPKVVKPQPMDGRPRRWEDIDDSHRIGIPALEISGVRAAGSPDLLLSPLITGNGKAPDPLRGDRPWTQVITARNGYETLKPYPVSWERDFVYAASQLRPAPPALEPRAPVSLHGVSREVLAAVFLGLKGTALEVWDGSAGWDGGFGWYNMGGGVPMPTSIYPYPDPATEETPWHRTRVDYGMTFGNSVFAPPGRPWYGPADYDPHALPLGMGGKPLVQSAPLGRLRETPAVTREQALALARELRLRMLEGGPLRTWAAFRGFVEGLPRWEDLNDDGILDGPPYPTLSLFESAHIQPLWDAFQQTDPEKAMAAIGVRRAYLREDLDSDGRMAREVFTKASGSWAPPGPRWLDPGRGRADLAPEEAPGLTFLQRDLILAMANPNTDLNDFNPDANLFKEMDKTDLAGIRGRPESYAHTTELCFENLGGEAEAVSVGRVLGLGGQLLAQRALGAAWRQGALVRHTTQADFLGDPGRGWRPPGEAFSVPDVPSPGLAGGQALASYPEIPEGGVLPAAYDGQLALGFVAPPAGPDETLRGALFGTADAGETGDEALPDLRGPARGSLLGVTGGETGNVFPDGVYSEKDRTLRFPVAGNLLDPSSESMRANFYVGFWVKPNWFPEASPRAHALLGLSRGIRPRIHATTDTRIPYAVYSGLVPLDDILARPGGIYFVPARNNASQDAPNAYQHREAGTRGDAWPRRSLIWGTTHWFFASDCLHRRGIETPPTVKPLGRLEARRWQHLGAIAGIRGNDPQDRKLGFTLGRVGASASGSQWDGTFDTHYFYAPLVEGRHDDGTENHIRFGEMASGHNMNYAADATFAGLRVGSRLRQGSDTGRKDAWGKPIYDFGDSPQPAYRNFLEGASSPAALGRYLKEDGAAYLSPKLPAGLRPLRVTWTEIPCELWFDENSDGWLGDAAGGYQAKNDRDGNGLRDVRIDLEVWDGGSRLAVFSDPAGENRLYAPPGCHYRAVFVNEWDAATRANHPLDVTPFLDDVTFVCAGASGPVCLAWYEGEE